MGAVVGLPTAGMLIGKVGSRTATVAGLAIMGCGLVLVSLAHNVAALLSPCPPSVAATGKPARPPPSPPGVT